VELNQRGKSNAFLDKRIGEYDSEMTPEDRMLARFQKARAKGHRNSALFRLDDDDDDGGGAGEDSLTHMGTRLGDLGSFDDVGLGSDGGSGDEHDEDAYAEGGPGKLTGAKAVGALHFGGGLVPAGGSAGSSSDDPQRRRTHKEIMEEVVLKAKKHKMERQELKRRTDTLTEQVDADLASIRGLLAAGSRAPEGAQAQLEQQQRQQQRLHGGGKDKDSFDVLVRELAFEAKARATDRTKTPAEAAAEEHERLQRLEAERVRRMHGASKTASAGIEAAAQPAEKRSKNQLSVRAGHVACFYVSFCTFVSLLTLCCILAADLPGRRHDEAAGRVGEKAPPQQQRRRRGGGGR
jgi:nucleolar protein 14